MTGPPVDEAAVASPACTPTAADTDVLERAHQEAAGPLPIPLQNLIEALDGVVYVTDTEGRLILTQRRLWTDATGEPQGQNARSCHPAGRSLFASMFGEEVEQLYRDIQVAVVRQMVPALHFDYRCDAPDIERSMRMAISPIVIDGEVAAILYQSVTVSEKMRPPMDIFLFEKLMSQNPEPGATAILTLCCKCHDVAWPIGAATEDATWIAPEDYYRRGGRNDVVVSHGLCPDCSKEMRALLKTKGQPAPDPT
ncbi:MAG: hypothetical protein AAGG56_16410 [Pseudomonadota bacterium]